jgi:hypothetical protein
MVVYTSNTASAKANRQVNVVRLLVDGVVGLQESKADIAEATNHDLDKWAANYKVWYTSVEDDKRVVRIVLEKHET